MSTVFFTIISRNYLAYATSLMETVAKQYPESPRYVFLADKSAGDPALATDLFEVVECAQLALPDAAAFMFRYDIMELNTAIKPYCFKWLRERHVASNAIYLDPDLYLLRPLFHVTSALEGGASAVLTPHLNDPMVDDGKLPDELTIMRSGVYNCGFVAIGHTAEAERLVDWWADKLEFACYADPAAGLFTDQKWVDLVPGMFSGVEILRHDGYNVAYWNLAQRRIAGEGTNARVNGVPLHFLHFSGVVLDKPDLFSKHQNRFSKAEIGGLAPFYENYLSCLERNEHRTHTRKPYAYGLFADGAPITRWHREVYKRRLDKKGKRYLPDPFSMDRSVFNEHTEELPVDERLPVTRLMIEVWRAREDLRAVFDVKSLSGRDKFVRWFISTASSELGLTEEAVAPIRDALHRGEASVLANIESLNYTQSITPPNLRLREIILRAVGNTGLQVADWVKRNPKALTWVDKLGEERKLRVTRTLRDLAATFVPAGDKGQVQVGSNEPAEPLLSAPLLRGGVNLVGYARGEFGVAENIRSYARALEAAGYPFVIRNFDVGVASRQADHSMDKYHSEHLPYATNIFFVNADQMSVVHQHLTQSAFEGRYNIGYWVWELEHFPQEWVPALDFVDEVWVPTEFVRGAIAERTAKPVLVIPKSIDFPQPLPVRRSHFQLPESEFVFLFSFDFNSYISRKYPEAVIHAFKGAFEDVEAGARLYIKCINGSRFPEKLDQLTGLIAGDRRITIVDGFLDRDQMFALQSVSDVYVSLHRSEGFGLGMAECMRLGKPVVATGYSGNVDFMNQANACLVDYSLVPLQEGDYPFWEGQHWADPDIAQAAGIMRRLFDDREYYNVIAAAARTSISATNSKSVCANAVISRLSAIDGTDVSSMIH